MMTSSGWSFPTAGRRGWITTTRAPGRPQDDLLPRRAQSDGGSDLLRALHVLQVDSAALLVVDPGRVDRGRRIEVGALVEAAEQALEERRLADDDVDVVDAAVGRVVAAGHRDVRRDGVGRVGQEHVLARRDEEQAEHDRDEREARDEQLAGREEPSHRSERAAPPSTWTVAPVMYAARSEARKQTTSPNSRGVPSRPSGICAISSAGRPAGPVELGHPRGVDPARAPRSWR